MTTLQKIKKIINERNKAFQTLNAESAAQLTGSLERELQKISDDSDRKLILQWLDEKNESHFKILGEALQAYKQKMKANIITINHKKYDLTHWCTITQYAKIFNFKSTQVITNQIKRGKITEENILSIPELDLKLIRLP